MKKLLLSIVFVAVTFVMLVAQTPQMTYQAVIRDANGQLLTNRSVDATVKVKVGASELFSQTYTETTNIHGLLTVTFGHADFATIDWANATISCEVKNGEDVYIAENFQPVTAVPLAIKAITENDPQFNASVASNIMADDTLYWNHKLDAEVDGSITNELQVLSISKDTIYLSNGGFVKLPAADGSETKVTAGTGVTINGSGTIANPYVVNQKPGTTAGEMQYWNGSAWVTIPAGINGQVLTFFNGEPTWKITKDIIYDVLNPSTGRIWMDRNLGASRVAINSRDSAAYGDLYQWGRGADGHQIRTSGTTSILSGTDDPGHGNYIISNTPPFDWRSSQNDSLWQGVNGINNPCPSGYRLPTEAEWNLEHLSWSSNDRAGAFASPLKLTLAGEHDFYSDNISTDDSSVSYWSSTVNGYYSICLIFYESYLYMTAQPRAYGCAVRCIKD